MQSVVSKICPIVKAGGTVSLFKSHNPRYRDGGQLRDFIYVKDCIATVRWLLRNPNINGLFNVGTGAARSFLDLVDAVGVALGRAPNIQFVDTPAEFRDKYLAMLGFEAISEMPEQFAAFLKADRELAAKKVKISGAKLD